MPSGPGCVRVHQGLADRHLALGWLSAAPGCSTLWRSRRAGRNRCRPRVGLFGHGGSLWLRVALVFAAPLACVLAYLLRPVRQQWIHIRAFFAVPTLAFWLLGSVLGLGRQPWLLIPWATVGAAAAIGRWAVRKDVLSSNSAAAPPDHPVHDWTTGTGGATQRGEKTATYRCGSQTCRLRAGTVSVASILSVARDLLGVWIAGQRGVRS